MSSHLKTLRLSATGFSLAACGAYAVGEMTLPVFAGSLWAAAFATTYYHFANERL